jgi:hypothetical protein
MNSKKRKNNIYIFMNISIIYGIFRYCETLCFNIIRQ